MVKVLVGQWLLFKNRNESGGGRGIAELDFREEGGVSWCSWILGDTVWREAVPIQDFDVTLQKCRLPGCDFLHSEQQIQEECQLETRGACSVCVMREGADFLVRASADPNSPIPLCVPTNTPDSDHKIMSGHRLVQRWLPLHGQLSSSHGAGMSDSAWLLGTPKSPCGCYA